MITSTLSGRFAVLKQRIRPLVGFPAWVILCIVAATPHHLHAQTSKGILAGVIRDSSGAVLPNASISSLTKTPAKRAPSPLPPPAPIASRRSIPATIAFTLPIPASPPSMCSTSTCFPPSSLPTTPRCRSANPQFRSPSKHRVTPSIPRTASSPATIAKQELQQVPIFTLNPADLTSELPGVTRQYLTVQNLGGVGGNGLVKLTVNGARPRANNFMMDGQDMNDVGLGGESIQPIMPDFFSSVTALLNDSSAEYGRAGGAVINQITQHGTNRFHGSVHEIYTGSGLDSIDGQSRRAKPLLPGQADSQGPL